MPVISCFLSSNLQLSTVHFREETLRQNPRHACRLSAMRIKRAYLSRETVSQTKA